MSLLRIPSRKSYITGFYKIRYYCQSKENEEQVLKCRTLIEFYKNYFGLSSKKTLQLCIRHPSLCAESVNIKDLNCKAELLKQMNFTPQEILRSPKSLITRAATLSNRLKVLEECCFSQIRIQHISGFFAQKSMRKSVRSLKAGNYIDKDANVPESLVKKFDVEIELSKDISDDTVLADTRSTILNLYLKAKLGMNDEEIERLWKIHHQSLKMRNFESIVNVINILQNQLHMSNQQIFNNGFLLYGSYDNMKQVIAEVPEIAGMPIKEVIILLPRLTIKTPEAIKSIINHIRSFDIPDDRILKCLDVLLLSKTTVHDRLIELMKTDEFKKFCNHPRLLTLVVSQNKAKNRLDYFKKLRMKGGSLSVLSCSSGVFDGYKRNGFNVMEHEDVVNDEKESSIENKHEAFVVLYAKLLGLSDLKARKLLADNPSLCSDFVEFDDIKTVTKTLKQMSFSKSDILAYPTILMLTPAQLKNRKKVLEECNIKKVGIQQLSRFVSLMNRKIFILKSLNYLNKDLDVQNHLVNQLDLNVELMKTISDNMSLKSARELIMRQYLEGKLETTSQSVAKLFTKVPWVKHKSFENLMKLIEILRHKLGFTNEQIIDNGILLCACPENLDRLLNYVPSIADVSLKEILLRKPQIALSNAESVKTNINHVKAFNIAEECILKCPGVLTFRPNVLYKRVAQLMGIKDFQLFCRNPNVLHLVYYQKQVEWRLDVLKQFDTPCPSINTLMQSDLFEKFARSGIDTTRGQDAIIYVAEELKIDREDVRNTFIRHSNWHRTPVSSIRSTLDYLYNKGFSDDDIRDNLYLILYPLKRIDEKLKEFREMMTRKDNKSMIAGVSLYEVSNSQLLNLCLYDIEKEFHFSGDGIWEPSRLERNQDQSQDVTLREIPECTFRVRTEGKKRKAKAVN